MMPRKDVGCKHAVGQIQLTDSEMSWGLYWVAVTLCLETDPTETSYPSDLQHINKVKLTSLYLSYTSALSPVDVCLI